MSSSVSHSICNLSLGFELTPGSIHYTPQSSPVFTGVNPFLASEPLAGFQNTPAFTCSLPSTSAAFQFFPDRTHHKSINFNSAKSDNVVDLVVASPRSHTLDAAMTQLIPTDNADQLRTDAFWELQRSVAESGEGLVSRMRDWESSQTQPSSLLPSSDSHRRRSSSGAPLQPQSVWTRKRSLPGQGWPSDSLAEDDSDASDDEDDIQIISGQPASLDTSCNRGPPQKKRAFSLSVMDVDYPVPFDPYSTPDSSERCSSPVDTHFTGVSEVYSDDEEEGGSSPPALTHAYTNSASSSLISLPLPPPRIQLHSSHPPSAFSGHNTLCVPSTASRTEKAIAALSLALANGAGGLNDYESLRATESKTSAQDESLVGEMWH